MTVCLGALCKDRDGRIAWAAVLASDRMVTMGGFIEYEHEVPKGSTIAHKAIALVAGDALQFQRVKKEAVGEMARLKA